MAVQKLRNFMNLPDGDLSRLALELLGAEDAAFVLVSPEGNIISQTEGARRLLGLKPLRPVAEALSSRAAQTVEFTRRTGGQAVIDEEIDGRMYRMEARPAELGVMLYFAPLEQAAPRLPDGLSRQIIDALSHILAAVHLMPGSGGEKGERLLDAIRRDSLRIYRGLSHLQFLTGGECPEQVMRLAETDLAALCRAAAGRCREVCQERGLDVRLETDIPPSCRVVCDKTLLLRALINLVVNALHAPGATRAGLRLTRQGGQVTLTVSDDGAGIPPEQAERLYSGWNRPAGEDAQLEQGVRGGLGLPLVRQVAGWHGGALLFEQGENGGTVFRLSFPDDLPPDPPQFAQGLPDEGLDAMETELSVL